MRGVCLLLLQVQALLDRHQPTFAAGGCQLSLQRAQHSHWVQIDVNPNVAVGQPGKSCRVGSTGSMASKWYNVVVECAACTQHHTLQAGLASGCVRV
jgi:hypothetical protein